MDYNDSMKVLGGDLALIKPGMYIVSTRICGASTGAILTGIVEIGEIVIITEKFQSLHNNPLNAPLIMIRGTPSGPLITDCWISVFNYVISLEEYLVSEGD